MNTAIRVVSVLLLVSLPAVAKPQGVQDELLDRMAGNWVMTGVIGGDLTHDLVAEWVLGHQYLRFHEVAREVDGEGVPAYESMVLSVGMSQYTCLWLDVTGVEPSFPNPGYAEPAATIGICTRYR